METRPKHTDTGYQQQIKQQPATFFTRRKKAWERKNEQVISNLSRIHKSGSRSNTYDSEKRPGSRQNANTRDEPLKLMDDYVLQVHHHSKHQRKGGMHSGALMNQKSQTSKLNKAPLLAATYAAGSSNDAILIKYEASKPSSPA